MPAWGAPTNPRNHSPANFRYLVHALGPHSKSSALDYVKQAAGRGISFESSSSRQGTSLYHHPERLAERMALSMSLIDQDHTATWADIGLIVEAPGPNIVLTAVDDTASFESSYDLDVLRQHGERYDRLSGGSLLRQSSQSSHNEVVAVGCSGDQCLRLGGFFYKITRDGGPYDAAQADRVRQQGARLGLPVVAIETAAGLSKPDGVVFHNAHNHFRDLGVHSQGSYYHFRGYPQWESFIVRDERGYESFASPSEMNTVLDFVRADGSFPEEYVAEIANRYRVVNQGRCRPRVDFSYDGLFDRITFYQGYGQDEQMVSIDKRGLAGRVHLAKGASAAALSGLEQRDVGGDLIVYSHPLAAAEIATIVATACRQLDRGRAGELKRWYKDYREVITWVGPSPRIPYYS